jgi:hypothetical protein
MKRHIFVAGLFSALVAWLLICMNKLGLQKIKKNWKILPKF